MTESKLKVDKDQLIHRAHNANIMQQIRNDMIINKGTNSSILNRNVSYFLDKNEIDQTAFLALSLDSIFYINKVMDYGSKDQNRGDQLQTTYKGYTQKHFADYQFTPNNFDLSFDDRDQLILSVTHPVVGEFYAYGFDKQSGKQGIKPYHKLDFSGSYLGEQSLFSRKIDKLRFVLTVSDSIYIHDFKIEDFYTHDH